MLCSIKNREDFENLNDLVALGNQVKQFRSQNKLEKQNFHENVKKVSEPVTKSIKNVSEKLTKTMTENSIKNNKALEDIHDKLLEIMIDRGKKASYLLSPLCRVTNTEHTSQFKLVKDPDSNTVMDLLMNRTIPVTLFNTLLTFSDTDKTFELQGDLLKGFSNKKYNVDLANLSNKRNIVWFCKGNVL